VLACNNLGSLLETGQGARRDVHGAVELYQRACSGGDAHGCFNLGRAHERGLLGGSNDVTAARGLYRRACDMGYQPACARAQTP